MSKIRTKTLLTTGIAILAYQGTQALAQDMSSSNPGAAPAEEIVVIGSNIRGIGDGSSPVITFTIEDIERSGVATMQQFFEKLSQNFGGGANGANVGNLGVDRDTGNNFGQGSSINLRGLGTGTTLTLINGHRVSSSNRYQYVDVSLIPVSAVERVEILTDGASAIYGADAVGGVVNIVLRQDFVGSETSVRYGTVTTGGLKEYQASQTAGWGWDGGNAMISYEFLEQNNLSALDKDFSRNVAYSPYDLYPGSTRHSFYADGTQRLNDSMTLNLTASFSKRDMDTNIASQWDVTNLFPQNQQHDLYAGLTIDLPQDWQARISAGYGKSRVRYERTSIENGVADTAPPTDTNSKIVYLDLIADGDLFELPAGAVSAAVGTSFRSDEFDLLDYRGNEDPFNPKRDISAAFTEINVPLLSGRPGAESLSITLAARHDDYSDFGSTTNPKVGMLWEVTGDLAFRANYGRSYRAPVFTEMRTNNGSYVYNLPNPNSPTGSTTTMILYNGNPNLDAERSKMWTGGFTLSPEAIPGLIVQGNYYQIDYSDRIDVGYVGSPAVLFSQSTDPYASVLTFNPSVQEIEAARDLGLNGVAYRVIRGGPYAVPADRDEYDTEVILDNRVRNTAFTSQKGIDFDAAYSFVVGENTFALSLAGQYMIDSTRQLTSSSPAADAINIVYLPVDLKMRGGATLNRRNLSGGIFLNYVDSYSDPSNVADSKVDSWTTVDMNIEYRFASDAAWLEGTSLAFNVQNLLDRNPPFIVNARGTGYDPTNATPLGRFLSLSLTHQW